MAKGDAAIGIPVPVSGWITALPVYQLPDNALSDGQNMLVFRDGLFKPRRGYEPLPSQPDAQLEPDPSNVPIKGGVAWSEVGNQMVVVATPTHWWLLLTTGWVDITGPPQSDDDPQVPARFAQFAFDATDHKAVLYGVDGAGNDPMRKWHLTDPVGPYTTMVDTANGDFTLAANDILVVADRLVAIYTAESDGPHPTRVRWSAVNNGSSWPPLAFNDLNGPAGNLICAQLSSRRTAVIYAQNGAWIMSATSGDDANAFAFDRLNGAYAAPYSPSAIVSIGGVHYYLATDQHIWRCDGQSAQPISAPIDAGLLRLVSTASEQNPVALYEASQFRLWFFFLGPAGQSQAVAYDLLTTAWSVPHQFPTQITMALPVIEQMGPTWDNPGTDSNGNDYTWDTAPWANWNSIPETNEPAVYVGLETGLVCRFGTAVTDNGEAITYSAVWGQKTGPDARTMLNVDTAEIYLQPFTEPEPVTVTIQGYQTPYDNAPTLVLDVDVAQNDIAQWLMESIPPSTPDPSGSFKNAVFMQFQINGVSQTGMPVFSGGWVYGNLQRRADTPVRDSNG